MTKAEDWCREQHCTELVLDVFSANQKAISFYERLGFNKEITKMVKSVTPKS
ncbi:GNAT family N-acetyltransferase [Streptococcus gallolyticus subsp. gallolyticus]|nr:GNAT family N-acetyltransferase [Streptococcus gallolyticus]MCY7202798.1 GNAT family N-acetyltransferase [Streptococcus gallolyticus subsp. gallolyticus]